MLFHVFTSNILNLLVFVFPLVTIVNEYIELIQAARIISPPVVVTFCSPLHLVRVDQFVIWALVVVGIILVIIISE